MGFFKRISERVKPTDLNAIMRSMDAYYGLFLNGVANKLCERLRQIGVRATLLSQDSPQALRVPFFSDTPSISDRANGSIIIGIV